LDNYATAATDDGNEENSMINNGVMLRIMMSMTVFAVVMHRDTDGVDS
jgi:hypothetical protein